MHAISLHAGFGNCDLSRHEKSQTLGRLSIRCGDLRSENRMQVLSRPGFPGNCGAR